MKKIINLIGASGSGKTTVARELEKQLPHKVNIIQSYTTRPPREDEEWGHTFIKNQLEVGHTDPMTLIEYIDEGSNKEYENIIAYFNSYKSGHHYFATDEQVIEGKTNIYIVDSKGAKQVHEYYESNPEVEVITVYLQADRYVRSSRLARRLRDSQGGVIENIDDYQAEVVDRLDVDDKLFDTVKCDYVIDGNNNIKTTVNKLMELI